LAQEFPFVEINLKFFLLKLILITIDQPETKLWLVNLLITK